MLASFARAHIGGERARLALDLLELGQHLAHHRRAEAGADAAHRNQLLVFPLAAMHATISERSLGPSWVQPPIDHLLAAAALGLEQLALRVDW
jgi:hypothetical protein